MKPSDSNVSLSDQLVGLWKNFVALLSDSLTLMMIETKLAKRSLRIICWLLSGMFVLALSTWFCVLGAIFCYFSGWGMWASVNFLLLALLNIALLIMMKYVLNFQRKNLSFNKTKHLFYSKEKNHESVEEKIAEV